MIEIYKILTNRYDVNVNLHLQQLQSNVTLTRGHNLKSANILSYDFRKYSLLFEL